MPENLNKVFIATSLDGYIADKNGGIDWLDTFPEVNETDTGYQAFIDEIDALVMGRNTFQKVLSFDIDWPYSKPVFVLSNSLNEIPEEIATTVQLVNGSLNSVLDKIHQLGFHKLYIDGGLTIQNFLTEDLIDEITITIVPVLLGDGIPLFGNLSKLRKFKCVETKLFFHTLVQNKFIRVRE